MVVKDSLNKDLIRIIEHPLVDAYGVNITADQDNFIDMFNSIEKVMASVSDYYSALKHGTSESISVFKKSLYEIEHPYVGVPAGYHELCDIPGKLVIKDPIMTGDRIIYNADSLDAKLVRYYHSTSTKPSEIGLFIPDYSQEIPLQTVLGTKLGLNFLQTLFDTTDTAKDIEMNLSKLLSLPEEYDRRGGYNKHEDGLIIKTPSRKNRLSWKEGMVAISLSYFGLNIDIFSPEVKAVACPVNYNRTNT